MRKTFYLAPAAQEDYPVTGQFILIDSAYASVRVIVNNQSYLMNAGDQLELDEFKEITLENTTGNLNRVQIRCGMGKFSPRVDHQQVQITDLPPMQVAEGQKVTTEKNNPVSGASLEDVVIPSGEKRRVLTTDSSRYELLIQNISEDSTTLRIGDENVSERCGLLMGGSQRAVGTISLNYGGDLYVYNASSTAAKISIFEVRQ